MRRRVAYTIAVGVLAAAVTFAGGSAAWANPVPDSGLDSGGTLVEFPIPGLTFTQISAGNSHTVALGSDGSAWAWGNNGNGQLGDGTNTSSSLPVRVAAPPGVTFTQIDVRNYHSVAIGSDGNTYAWGANTRGQLGDGTTTDRNVPTQVSAPSGVTFTQIAAGNNHIAAIGSDGNTYAWGYGEGGRLGDGTTTDSNVPVQVLVPAGVTFTRISAGNNHTLASGSDGQTYAWGNNTHGNVGDGTTVHRSTPVPVAAPAGVTFTDIAAGNNHSIAVGSDGISYMWGSNNWGQLGNGTTAGSSVPLPVSAPAGVTFTLGSAGNDHTLAIGSDGTTYGWGRNLYGEVGDGTVVGSSVPIAVLAPAGVTFTQISAGTTHSAALGADGNAYSWGRNTQGQLGDGTLVNSSSPVPVVTPAVVVTGISFGGVAGAGLSETSPGVWSVTTPAHTAGPVDVAVAWELGGVAQPPIIYLGGFTFLLPPSAPTVTDPVDQSVTAGGSATFSVTATGNPAPQLEWEVSTDGVTWQPIAADSAAIVAADGLSITIANVSVGHSGFRYRVSVSNSEGTVVSSFATLTVAASGASTGIGTSAGSGTGSAQLSTTGGGSPIPFLAIAGAALLAGVGILTHRLTKRRAPDVTGAE